MPCSGTSLLNTTNASLALRVLVDGESKRKGRLVGKDSAFIIVEFSGDPSLIGTFQNVRITEARNWAVLGELVEEEQA